MRERRLRSRVGHVMKQSDSQVELLLRLVRAGNRKVHLAQRVFGFVACADDAGRRRQHENGRERGSSGKSHREQV
jgi:hypothetical protein